MDQAIITVNNVSKTFQARSESVDVLKTVSLEIKRGDFMIIIGPSGCGKSTLLHTILGLEPPTSGTVTMLGKNLYADTTEDDRSEFRKRHVGMVYQQPNWIKALNVVENVAFPLLLLGRDRTSSREAALATLKIVNMEDRANYAPTELSSGQQQRVALARALALDPEIIVADEPTGNLDFNSGQQLMQLVLDLNKNKGKTVLMVTHDIEYVKFAKSMVKIKDGQIEGIYSEDKKKNLVATLTGKRGNAKDV